MSRLRRPRESPSSLRCSRGSRFRCRPSGATFVSALRRSVSSAKRFHDGFTSNSRPRPPGWSSPVAPDRPISRSRRAMSLGRTRCLAGRPSVAPTSTRCSRPSLVSPFAALGVAVAKPASSLYGVKRAVSMSATRGRTRYGKYISKRCYLITQLSLLFNIHVYPLQARKRLCRPRRVARCNYNRITSYRPIHDVTISRIIEAYNFNNIA